MSSLKSLLRTTPKYISLLAAHGITSARDFLYYFPRDYQDRTQVTPLAELFFSDIEVGVVTAQAQVLSKKPVSRGPKRFREIKVQDADGNQAAALFAYRASYMIKSIKKDSRVLLIGKPQYKYGSLTFRYPEIIPSTDPAQQQDRLDTAQTGRIYPIYPEMMGIKPARFAKKMFALQPKIPDLCHEYLPPKFLELFQLMDVPTTVQQLHFPESLERQRQAEYRMVYDRLLRIQLRSLLFRHEYQDAAGSLADTTQLLVTKIGQTETVEQEGLFDAVDAIPSPQDTSHQQSTFVEQRAAVSGSHTAATQQASRTTTPPNRSRITQFTDTLPFVLTDAQKRVITEMIRDIHTGSPMLRLLQGDVGSGKTVVAAAVAYYVIQEYGQQVAFLAPLSILAQQHYQGLAKLLMPLGVRVDFLAGSLTAKQKQQAKDRLAQGMVDLVVGTHALIQDDVAFMDLGLAIVDEQHKFGVRQRAFFKRVGSPHIIQMSATPIPRSLALAFFGEFDVSTIDQMPAGRKPIITKIVGQKEFPKLRQRFLSKIHSGQKLFVVTPLVQESDKLENLKDATSEWEQMCELFPELRGQIGLLHGKMKPDQKDDIMQAFKSGELMILVATTVIEVGVDIPEATMMLITNAERFGLAQLHQLRGRIGRNDIQSYCFLETNNKSDRLKAMEDHTDGFKLAELDLQYRGSGEILGTRQSGETDIPYHYLTDQQFMTQVKQGADRLLEHYPNLDGLPQLMQHLEQTMGGMMV